MKFKNFLRYANANAVKEIAVSNSEHPNKDLSAWKVDLVQTEIELISKNPKIDGQHKLVLEWVVTPPDYDETIDNRLTIAIKGILRYRSIKIIEEKIVEPSNVNPIILDDLDMFKNEDGTYVPMLPEHPDYVWYQKTKTTGMKNGKEIIIYDKEISYVKK